MKKRAFTLAEQLFVIIIIGVFAAVMINTMKPGNVRKDVFKKTANSAYIQIEVGFRALVAKNTKNYTLTRMVDSSGEFSVASSGSVTRMVNLLKKNIVAQRNSTLDSTYSGKELKNEAGTVISSGLKPSSFTGFIAKNGMYVGIKLHNNCTTQIGYIYNPAEIDTRTVANTCGIVFFDLNQKEEPNIIGVDQYILPIGKYGIK